MHAERALQPPMHDDVLSMFAGRTKNAVKVVKAWSRPETMKFLTIALLLITPAFAQMTSLPCVPPPAPPPPANAASQGRGRGSYFSHLFRDQVGVSPAKFLRDFRMREAEHLIRTTSLPLRAIFPLVGVTDRSHFVRKFTQCYGLAPSRYRDRKVGKECRSRW